MPWMPELFSAQARVKLEIKQERDELSAVSYFAGLIAGEPDALVKSFAGEPEVHDPVRGRIKGTQAFGVFMSETSSWLGRHDVSVEQIEQVITERRGFEEVVLHFDGRNGRVDFPVAIVADRRSDGRLDELRIYFNNFPFAGRHTHRPPLLQPDLELRPSDVVGDYQRGLAVGDVDAILETFEPDGFACEAAVRPHVQRDRDDLRSFYELLLANGGGIGLEHCSVVDDGRACALEYNLVRWGKTEIPPQAGSQSTCGAVAAS